VGALVVAPQQQRSAGSHTLFKGGTERVARRRGAARRSVLVRPDEVSVGGHEVDVEHDRHLQGEHGAVERRRVGPVVARKDPAPVTPPLLVLYPHLSLSLSLHLYPYSPERLASAALAPGGSLHISTASI